MDRLQHAWNAFKGEDRNKNINLGYSSISRPDRVMLTRGNDRSIITSVYNKIALDCSAIEIKHVRLDENGRYIEDIKSRLNECLTVEANKDQHSKAFFQDVVMSLFDEGNIAIVPVDTTTDKQDIFTAYDIETLRTGKILEWYPDHVTVEVYNDRKGIRENLKFPKSKVAIIENPFYAVMNEKNSVLQRLIRKLNILDAIDEQSGSGKLDLIIQLPYVIKTEARKKQAELRRADIENQLSGSKYGIAYTDGTEKITQLNRSVENNLLAQIESLTSTLYDQLGITTGILDGSADDKTMANYINRTVLPVINAIIYELNRKFLTRTARSQMQAITYFSNPFKLIPVSALADIADKFTRNEILTSNEIRQLIGLKPSADPKADELRNKNINNASAQEPQTVDPINNDEGGENQNG